MSRRGSSTFVLLNAHSSDIYQLRPRLLVLVFPPEKQNFAVLCCGVQIRSGSALTISSMSKHVCFRSELCSVFAGLCGRAADSAAVAVRDGLPAELSRVLAGCLLQAESAGAVSEGQNGTDPHLCC